MVDLGIQDNPVAEEVGNGLRDSHSILKYILGKYIKLHHTIL